jgi:glycerophosphoryl diester phosphodiesterase
MSRFSKTLIVGHRGAPTVAPENTMLSFREAWKIGVDMIEFDLQSTKDGRLVVIHDYELSRLTSREGYVGEMDYSELIELDMGEGEHIPLLADVLDWAKGKVKLNIEIKIPDIEHETLQLVDESGMTDSVLFSSFIQSVVERIKDISANCRTALLLNELDYTSIRTAKELNANAINPLFYAMPKDFVQDAHHVGLEVFPWTVNDREIMMDLVKQGVDGIITDYPDIAISARREFDDCQ